MADSDHARPRHRRRSGSSSRSSQPPNATSSWFGGRETQSLDFAGWMFRCADLALVAALFGTTAWFGGRTPVGQLLFVSIALLAAGCTSIGAWRQGGQRWLWTGSEWLWGAALCVLVLQVVELPEDWIARLSPRTLELLPLWGEDINGNPVPQTWKSLSLSPSETLKGARLFAAYGLLFFTLIQRLRTANDITRMLQCVALASTLWAAFGLLQLATTNGLYYWVFEHPFSSTSSYATGPFTNRNHYGQLLSLGIGPLVWCIARSLSPHSNTEARANESGALWVGPPWFWGAGLVLTILAVALSLSRGGFLAAAVAAVVSGAMVIRVMGIRNQWLSLAMLGLLLATGGLGYSGFDRILQRAATIDNDSRFNVWKANIAVWRDFPWVGTGIGTHADAHQTRLEDHVHHHVYTHAEGSYFQVASETGSLGLGIAAMMILLALSWPLRVLVSTQASTDARAAAAGILGSLLGHLAHACADFIWYVPACMVTVATLVACGFGLWRQHVAQTVPLQHRAGARWCWGVSAIATVLLAIWMLPPLEHSASAEGLQFDYQRLTHLRGRDMLGEDQETRSEWEVDRARVALQAAKADPLNPHSRLILADACLRTFNVRQQSQDPPFTLLELKDVVVSSGFSSGEEAQAWLRKVTGKNYKLLELAWRHAQATARLAPLQASAYLTLMELSFLHDPTGRLESELIRQAVALNPSDPQVQFVVGKAALVSGKQAEGMEALAHAFRGSPPLQPRIAAILVSAEKPDDLLQRLEPDVTGTGILADAYEQAGDTESAQQLWRRQIELAHGMSQTEPTISAKTEAWMIMFRAYVRLEDPAAAQHTLERAIGLYPQTAAFRAEIVDLLAKEGRLAEAVEHLRWLDARNPDDDRNRKRLEQAIDEQGRIAGQPSPSGSQR